MAADAETIGRYFLRAQLVGGPTGDRAYDTEIPAGGAHPAIVWAMQSAVDAQVNGPEDAWTNTLWLVRGIAKTATYATVEPISEWIHSRINRAAHVPVFRDGVQIGTVISCIRALPWRLAEAPNNVPFRHKGGIYRLMIKKV